MRHITINEPGGADVLALAEGSKPQPGPGKVLIKVKAAGINRADVARGTLGSFEASASELAPATDTAAIGCPNPANAQIATVQMLDRYGASAFGWRSASGAEELP